MYIDGEIKKISLHRHLLDCKPGDGKIVDHATGNTLDNRKANIRICTASGNQRNSKRQTNNQSGRSGVGYHKASRKWRARIVVNNKEIYLGVYDNYEDACKAREEAESKYFKEFTSYEYRQGIY